jgi:hypothetical protein
MLILGTSTFPSTVKSGTPFSLTVNFLNLGTTTAQSMIITPNGTSGLQPSSTDKIFLGDLAVNIPSSFTISYTAIDVTSGSYNVNLNYTYKDSLGGIFVDTLKVPFKLTVGTNITTQSQGDALGGILPYISLVAASTIVTAGLLYLRRRRARSNK